MNGVELARRVIALYADADGLTDSDCQRLVRESPEDSYIDPAQCTVLQEVLGTGQGGVITDAERLRLSKAFSDDFIDAIAGKFGKRALYVRILKLVELRASLDKGQPGSSEGQRQNSIKAVEHELGEIGHSLRIALPYLMDRLMDSDPDMRAAAAMTVGMLGPKASEAVAALATLMDDDDPRVIRLAALALAAIGEDARGATEALARALGHDDEVVRRAAAYALGKIGAREATPKLVKMLNDKSSWTRANAAKALGQLRASEATGELMRLLSDHNAMVRIQAADALGMMGPPAIVAAFPLGLMLRDPDANVRRAAARAIWRLGPDAFSALNLLENAKADPDPEVSQFASWALENIRKRHPSTEVAISYK